MSHVSPSMFLTMILTQPMTPDSQQLVAKLWVAWMTLWLKEVGCYDVDVSTDPSDPALVVAKFRVQGMPNSDSMIEVPVPDDLPYSIHVMAKTRTGVR
jgi:hypothetical protein